MFNSFKQSAIAAVGAIILTVTAVAAAVGPARAIETAPVSYVQTAQIAGGNYA
jgi:hypothetical protein